MRSSFAARRKPRRVGQDDEGDGSGDVQMQDVPNYEHGMSSPVCSLTCNLTCVAPDG